MTAALFVLALAAAFIAGAGFGSWYAEEREKRAFRNYWSGR